MVLPTQLVIIFLYWHFFLSWVQHLPQTCQGLDIVLITIIVNNVWRDFEAYLSFSGVFFTPKVSGLREESSHVLLGFLGG